MSAAERLAQWRATTDAATEGPWVADHMNVISTRAGWWSPIRYDAHRVDHDHDFIAESRTAMPALLAFAEAVLAACDESDEHTFEATAYDGVDRVSTLPVTTLRRLANEHLGGAS